MILNAKVSSPTERQYVLTSRGREVGWIRSGTLGFTGFATIEDARRAAGVAAELLARWYLTRWRTRTVLPLVGAVDSDHAIALHSVVVGRLLSPPAERTQQRGTFGFELRVPDDLWVATALELAQRLYTAICEGDEAAAPVPA